MINANRIPGPDDIKSWNHGLELLDFPLSGKFKLQLIQASRSVSTNGPSQVSTSALYPKQEELSKYFQYVSIFKYICVAFQLTPKLTFDI